MSLLTTFKDTLKQNVDTTFSNVGTAMIDWTFGTSPMVKTGEPPKGNLTEAQIKAGMRGGNTYLKTPETNIVSDRSIGFGLDNASGTNYVLWIGGAIVGVVALYFLLKK